MTDIRKYLKRPLRESFESIIGNEVANEIKQRIEMLFPPAKKKLKSYSPEMDNLIEDVLLKYSDNLCRHHDKRNTSKWKTKALQMFFNIGYNKLHRITDKVGRKLELPGAGRKIDSKPLATVEPSSFQSTQNTAYVVNEVQADRFDDRFENDEIWETYANLREDLQKLKDNPTIFYHCDNGYNLRKSSLMRLCQREWLDDEVLSYS